MNFIDRALVRVAQRLSNERVPFDSKKYIEVVASIEKYLLSNKNFQGDFNNSLYEWGTWVEEIFGALSINCGVEKKYRDPFELEQIKNTMIYPARSLREMAFKINLCKKSLGSERMSKVVSDDFGTSLKLFPTKYGLATPNNIHHLMHVSSYISCSGEEIFSSPVYVEFGGGYGNMARLMKLFNESATYVIVDISVILGIQYWYLSNTIGENNISICTDGKIIPGKVNLISTEIFLDINLHSLFNDFMFISTWALTESPEWLQKHKKVRDVLHSAKRLLLASACDENDFISEGLPSNVARVQVPRLEQHHKYMLL